MRHSASGLNDNGPRSSSRAYHATETLHWRHNDHDSVSNHQPHGCLLNRLFRRRSKKTSKLRVTGLCVGNSPGPVNSPHKGPVTRKMFPFDDVIMESMHCGWDEMVDILQLFWNYYSCTKAVVFWLIFHWNLFTWDQLKIYHDSGWSR